MNETLEVSAIPRLGVRLRVVCKQDQPSVALWSASTPDGNRFFFSCIAAIAQLGERQTEDLKVPGSIPGLGTLCPFESQCPDVEMQRLRMCFIWSAATNSQRAHPDLNQGPADLQSAALTTELCTHGRANERWRTLRSRSNGCPPSSSPFPLNNAQGSQQPCEPRQASPSSSSRSVSLSLSLSLFLSLSLSFPLCPSTRWERAGGNPGDVPGALRGGPGRAPGWVPGACRALAG